MSKIRFWMRDTRRLVTRLCTDGLDWSPHSCLALFVLALGAIATTFGTSDEEDTAVSDCLPLARSFARAAQKRLGLTIEGSDRVLEAQCHFFAGVYAMTVFERDGAWKLFLHAPACCQSFQFLRLPRDNQPVSNLSETPVAPNHRSLALEQAIYWSSWKSERELRMQMDIADFSLCPADMAIYPSFFPTPPRTVSDQSEAIGDPIYDREQLSWYFYLSEICLRRLTSCIVSGILNFKSSSAGRFLDELAHATCMYESQGEEWALRLPQMISIEGPPEADGVCHFVLRGHLLNLQEVVYWPFVDALIAERLVEEDQYLVRSLARKGLQKHMERLWVNRPGYNHRHHGTLFLLRNCSRSALVLIAAALSIRSQLDRQIDPGVAMPVGWREAVSLALEMALYWKDISEDSAYLAKILESAWKKVENY
ncbi:fungal specific transcription factor domain-containing protein [Aspergillus melleus]|uniref:fungal specific transcription factor domain-containing protein n=1 Tax=Aspergillus melleus TaxID=138277 RepID=UPI001E8D9D6E|nr:uncharacterized protein LDX57_007634 [Aspergillus melleus]KAH8429962.1 hypothetical protein LDX57_007634 [Aspergillus melleus]